MLKDSGMGIRLIRKGTTKTNDRTMRRRYTQSPFDCVKTLHFAPKMAFKSVTFRYTCILTGFYNMKTIDKYCNAF